MQHFTEKEKWMRRKMRRGEFREATARPSGRRCGNVGAEESR
jgi:hypothetical protein